MNPVSVLRMARAMNIEVKNVLLVGCEPDTLGGEEGQMGLSAPVRARRGRRGDAGGVFDRQSSEWVGRVQPL